MLWQYCGEIKILAGMISAYTIPAIMLAFQGKHAH